MAWYREVEQPKGIGLDPSTRRPADYFYGKYSHSSLLFMNT